MIPKECKRLAEVDFPIAVVSKHSARKVDPARAPVHTALMVGEAATGSLSLNADGVALARPVRRSLPR